jgi:NADH-quinone oxidoreductase subunit C
MPSISAEELRERIGRDLPGILAPSHQSATSSNGAASEQQHGEKSRPDFLSTNDTVIVAERLIEAATYMRDSLGYTFLSDIAVVDYLDDGLFELVYRFYHLDGGEGLVLKVRVPRDKPDVPALSPIWPGADFHEREGFDLFGINFVGHPFLRRIYMWDEFEGYPMRKDFPKQGDKYFDDDE